MPLWIPDPVDPRRRRAAFVVIPPDWFNYLPLPVVIGLHPGGGSISPLGIAKDIRFHEVAQDPDGPRFVTIYPEAHGPDVPDLHGSGWSNGFSSPTADLWGTADARFVASLLDTLQTRMSAAATALVNYQGNALDGERLFAFGFSSGGNGTYRLAYELPRVSGYALTAFFVAAGHIGGQFNSSETPVVNSPLIPPACPQASVLHCHGRNDPSTPFNGGYSGLYLGGLQTNRGLSLTEAEAFCPVYLPAAMGPELWAVHDGIPGLTTYLPTGVPQRFLDRWGPYLAAQGANSPEFRIGTNAGRVVAAAYADYDHTWPAFGVDFARMVWDFFNHPTDFLP